MEAPPSFWKLCLHFHQDIASFVPVGEPPVAPEQPLVYYLVNSLRRDEKQELAGFLDGILGQPDADVLLSTLWNRSQADFRMFPDSRLERLFSAIRSAL